MTMTEQDAFFEDTLTIAQRSVEGVQAATSIIGTLLDMADAGTLTPELIARYRALHQKAEAVYAANQSKLHDLRQKLELARWPARGMN